jgi:CxxC motif-containing protein (DUF1111 family)
MSNARCIVTLVAVGCLSVACSDDASSAPVPEISAVGTSVGNSAVGTSAVGTSALDLARSGGDATVFVDGTGAFAQPLPSLTTEQRRAFSVGNNFFNDNWVTAPASTEGRDGLGPLFNAQSCSSCHEFDGRGEPPATDTDATRGLLLRLSVLAEDGRVVPDPVYGGQLQDRAINGVAPEGRIAIAWTDVGGAYSDGTPYVLQSPQYSILDLGYGPLTANVAISARVAPAVFGVGLLEAIDEDTIMAGADPADSNGDGISGRPNRVPSEAGDLVVGRFGWKANVATVKQQNAGAFHGDIGITSSLHTEQGCTATQRGCLDAPTGGTPELDDQKLERVTFYTRTLAVPARRAVTNGDTRTGEELFATVGCVSCHIPTLRTARVDLGGLSNQTIHPYTDLLLHDMGPGLADNRPDGEATGAEWRTAPLWGIGLIDTVNGHTRLLHDGRARGIEQAILWHGGEASAAQGAFVSLSAVQRRQLIAFLESL